jgi:WD40 repeat protein
MAETGPASYDGFLSYSHAADDLLAPRLQAGLQRFAKPWWKRRALHIFRDEASLSANPHLWSSITDALDDSDWFVLLLSPEAAGSEWVNREIDYWKEHRDPHKILPAVTDGTFRWADSDVAGDAVPPSLQGVFEDEPRWVDLRFARTETQLDLRHARFRDAVADIAAAVRGVAKDELESEEIRQHRRTVRTAWTAGVAILALGVAATVGAVVAYNAQQNAQEERDRAVAAELTATEERDRANQEADRANLLAEHEAAARTEAEEQRTLAEEQAKIAQANADLARSRELAASAINVLDDDPELSVLLALEAAVGADPTFESVSALREALQKHRTIRTVAWPEEWAWDGLLAGSISPDGHHLAVSGARNRLAVWDVQTDSDQPLWSFEVPWPDYAVIIPYFNTDGSHVVATVAWFNVAEPADSWPEPPPEEGVYVFDTATGNVVTHIRGPDCPINGLFQTGRYLDEDRLVGAVSPSAADCSVGYPADEDVWMLDLRTGELALGLDKPVPSGFWGAGMSLSRDGRLMTASDFYFRSWVVDLATGATVFETSGGGASLLTADGTRLLAGSPTSISLWGLDSETELWSLKGLPNLTDIWFSHDESLIYAGANDGVVRIWDSATGVLLHEMKGHRGFTWPNSMTVDSTKLASFSGDRTVKIWDLTANSEGEIAGFDLPGLPIAQSGNFVDDLAAFLLYPDEASFFTEPAIAFIVDTVTGVPMQSFDGYGGQMVRLSPDGTLLAGQPFVRPGVLGPVNIRSVETGEILLELDDWCTFDQNENAPGPECSTRPGVLGDAVWWIDFSPDGTLVAVAGDRSAAVGVWDVMTGQRLTWLSELASGPGDLPILRFSPDSDLLVAVNPELVVFETQDWSTIASLPSGIEWWDLTFTPDGRYIFGGSRTTGVVTVDTTTWEYVGDPLPGHQGGLRDIDLSPDGSLIAVASSDGFARLWDTRTSELTQAIPFGDGVVTFVHFLTNDHLLAIPSGRPALTMTIDINELIDIARWKVTRTFTDGECATYHLDPCPSLETIQGG